MQKFWDVQVKQFKLGDEICRHLVPSFSDLNSKTTPENNTSEEKRIYFEYNNI